MLDSFKLIANSAYKDRCELHIFGPDYQGRYAHVTQMIAERSLENNVALHPAIFGSEKEKILLDADVFIQTSRTEALTLGILEALSYGLPCLVTPGTTWGSFIEDYNAGWVAQPCANSVFEQIVSAISGRELFKEKSENARELVAENFSWEKNTQEIIASYRFIAERRGN